MATGAVASARDTPRDVRWKWLLLILCAIVAAWIAFGLTDRFGFGSRPWFGFWDSTPIQSGEAFVLRIASPLAGGATDRAGIRDGDRADVREQPWAERVVLLTQPIATQPTTLVLHRGSTKFVAPIVGSTILEGAPLWKLAGNLPVLFAGLCFLTCATLIAIRRSSRFEGRLLALALICLVLQSFVVVTPNATLTLFLYAGVQVFSFLALLLILRLSSHFGKSLQWRQLLEFAAYSALVLDALWDAAFYVGVVTLKFNPLPFWFGQSYNLIDLGAAIVVAIGVSAAVATTPPQQRPRVGWLLLPLPLAILGAACAGYFASNAGTWFSLMFFMIVGNASMVIGAMLVTYALLKRRVLDFGFVLSRALVVSIVGLIVVIAFVLLEWLLGSVLTGVSHATGLIANAALALVIGVSLNYIHKHVDQSVDLVLFRKRHEDEQSLLAFSKEAAYITEWDALLNATLEKVRRHTDALSASVLIGVNGFYSAPRSFGGNTVASVNENDEAILALKVWHKPIDPHHYETALHAALALPMLSRGKLYGVLILGERAGGEAYAPDEIDVLSQLANGVGSALEALSLATNDTVAALGEQIKSVASTCEKILSEIRNPRTSLPT